MERDVLIDLQTFDRYTAIAHIRLTERMTEGEELIPGGACAAVLEAELYGDTPIPRGRELKYFHDSVSLGIFRVEESRVLSAGRYKITCYDLMTLFDRDVTEAWNSKLPGWASTALTNLCKTLGVTIANTSIPSEKLEALEGIRFTGRQLLKWLGQRWGMYFRMSDLGQLNGRWITDTGTALGDYRMDGLTVGAYDTKPIARVWVRQTEADTGSVYPDGLTDSANTLILQGNPYGPEPQTVYEKMKDFSYRPFRCAVLTAPALGTVVTLPDGGKGPIMERVLEDSVWTVSCTGSPSLQSTEAWNSLEFSDLRGRMLSVEKSVEGLRVAASETDGRITELELTADGIHTRVEQTENELRSKAEASAVVTVRSELSQRADSLEFSVTEVRTGLDDKADKSDLQEVTEHFRFDMDGLTITNTGTGMGIGVSEQRVIFTGGENPTTVILPNAMETTDINILRSMVIGCFSLLPRANGNLSLRFTGGVNIGQ